MRIGLTGVAGFIGSHLTERLVQLGYEVSGVDNFDPFYDRSVKERNLATIREVAGFTLHEVDVLEEHSLVTAFEGCEKVIHLAALAGVRPSFDSMDRYTSVNVTGTARVIRAALNSGVRDLVYASSSSVYGVGADVPFKEAAPLGRPASPYATTKLAGEYLCFNSASDFRSICALRLFTAYGPRQRPDLAVHKFARLILDGEPIPVFGDASKTYRDYTYVGDIVEGIVASLSLEEQHEVINLGSGSSIQLSTLIGTLEEVLGIRAKKEQLPSQRGDLEATWADISKAERLLRYAPSRSLRDGLTDFVEWQKDSRKGTQV